MELGLCFCLQVLHTLIMQSQEFLPIHALSSNLNYISTKLWITTMILFLVIWRMMMRIGIFLMITRTVIHLVISLIMMMTVMDIKHTERSHILP